MTTINWQQWHTAIVDRMQRILTSWGKADVMDYETLRKAEVTAIAQLRKEKHAKSEIVH
jgi:hypothetical protein